MTGRDDATIPLEKLLGRLLLAGAVASALCLAAGLGAWLLDAGSLGGRVLLEIGLIVLMAAPALRVVIAIVEAVKLRDWLFVASTVAVAAVLGVTLALTLSGIGG